jgi:hypothetical protein
MDVAPKPRNPQSKVMTSTQANPVPAHERLHGYARFFFLLWSSAVALRMVTSHLAD